MTSQGRWQVSLEEQTRSERREEVLLNLSMLYGVSNIEGRCGVGAKCVSLTIQVTLKVAAQRS